jgi:hypothetical protein
LNLVVGFILFRVGHVSRGDDGALAVFFAGIVAMSTALSVRFAKKRPSNRNGQRAMPASADNADVADRRAAATALSSGLRMRIQCGHFLVSM